MTSNITKSKDIVVCGTHKAKCGLAYHVNEVKIIIMNLDKEILAAAAAANWTMAQWHTYVTHVRVLYKRYV
jgi:hypothetical protein